MKLDRKSAAVLVSMGTNSFLVLLKGGLSLISGSLALLADAIHSGSDILVDALVLAGIKVSEKETIPSPLRRGIENTIAIVIAIIIWFSAFAIFGKALGEKVPQIEMLPLAISGAFVSIVVSYFLSRYKTHVGRATSSPALIADGEHSKTDMYSSIAVLVGLTGYMMGFRLDSIAAIVVGVLILKVGLVLFHSALKAILSRDSLQFIELRLEKIPLLNRMKISNAWNKISLHRRPIIWTAGAGLISIYLLSGFYTVSPGEEAVVRRFGRIVEEGVTPGAHYCLPYPFEQATAVDTKRMNRVEIGFRTRKTVDEEPDAYLWETRHVKGRYEKAYDEALMLTGDQNIVDVWLVVHYRIRDMTAYLFKVDSPDILIKGASEAAVRQMIAKEDIDVLLTTKRHWIEREIGKTLQAYLESYGFGVEITKVAIPVIHPPIEVVPVFRSIASASEDKERYIREAESYFNRVVPRARADAARIAEEARAYRISKVNRAKGEADRFSRQLEVFRASREITTTRIYLETMERVLPGINKFIFTPGAVGDTLDLRPFIGKRSPLEGLTAGEKK